MNSITFVSVTSIVSAALFVLFAERGPPSRSIWIKIALYSFLVLAVLDLCIHIFVDVVPVIGFWILEEILKFLLLFRILSAFRVSCAVYFGWLDLVVVNALFPAFLAGFDTTHFSGLYFVSGLGVLTMHLCTGSMYTIFNAKPHVALLVCVVIHVAFNSLSYLPDDVSNTFKIAIYIAACLSFLAVGFYGKRLTSSREMLPPDQESQQLR